MDNIKKAEYEIGQAVKHLEKAIEGVIASIDHTHAHVDVTKADGTTYRTTLPIAELVKVEGNDDDLSASKTSEASTSEQKESAGHVESSSATKEAPTGQSSVGDAGNDTAARAETDTGTASSAGGNGEPEKNESGAPATTGEKTAEENAAPVAEGAGSEGATDTDKTGNGESSASGAAGEATEKTADDQTAKQNDDAAKSELTEGDADKKVAEEA